MRKSFILAVLLSSFISINFSAMSFSEPNFNMRTDKEKQAVNSVRQQILSELETKLDSNISTEGQDFSAKLMEDVFYDGHVLIPKFSMAYGKVAKIDKSGVMNKEASIKLKITKIITPDEQDISIEDKPMLIELFNSSSKSPKTNFIKGLPAAIAGSATSVVLGRYSPLADAAVFAISTGARFGAGCLSGVISPDAGKSRAESSAKRALESTPIGSVSSVVKKGEDISLEQGQYICIFFEKEILEYINEKYEHLSAGVDKQDNI